MAKQSKKCFVIGPIGKPNSDDRRRSDQIFTYIIEPAVHKAGYSPMRADKLPSPGQITTQIIKRLVEDDLVIADLTGRNANVFYELAIRQCAKKPVIQIMAEGESLPFDVGQTRTIFFNHQDLDSVKHCIQEICAQIETIKEHPDQVDNPVVTVLDLIEARGSDNPQEKLTAEIFTSVSQLSAKLEAIEASLSGWQNVAQINARRGGAGAEAVYIDGEKEAFEALTDATKRARHVVRSTRFFPDSVLKQPAYVSAMEQRILGSDGNPKLKHYYRIVAVNNYEKQSDIIDHLNKFFGQPFELYLTDNENAFEIVVIDDTDAFIHFYKEEKVIASTLHLQGKLVVEEFIQIFEKLKARQQIAVFNCAKITRGTLMENLGRVNKLFESKFDGIAEDVVPELVAGIVDAPI